VPASPSTPSDSDIDFSFDLSQIDIDLASEELNALQSAKQYPEYMRSLLEECFQEETGPYEFSAFIESFPLDPILQDARRAAKRKKDDTMMMFRKIGEASYSEVFGIGDVVLKVIPLRDELRLVDEEELEDGPAPSDAKDVRKEIIVTRAMGDVHDRFVRLLKTYVVRGKYPEVLLNLWDEYNEQKGSESIRPGKSVYHLPSPMLSVHFSWHRYIHCFSILRDHRPVKWWTRS
jgi:serine/threonine-protein kinase haspin